jgi:hypothetical protein
VKKKRDLLILIGKNIYLSMKENLKFEKIYDEIPFNIINSPLDKALFYEYQDDIFKKEEKE